MSNGKNCGRGNHILYGDLDEEIYMECPEGMVGVTNEDVLLLNKCIYGLVQASRQYHKKAVEILKRLNFQVVLLIPAYFQGKMKKD